MQLPKKQFWTVLLSILVLRLVVGFHFFSEGWTKVQSGTFSSAGFLKQAKGPMAGFFIGLLNDHDGRMRLGVEDSGASIDLTKTFAIWEHYLQSVDDEVGFDESQRKQARLVVDESKKHLDYYLTSNEGEILAWLAGEQRLAGFQRDGDSRSSSVNQVQSLNEQLETIKYDRSKTVGPWLKEVETTWDELEARINRIAGTESAENFIRLSRPFDEPWSTQNIIDRCLPWFDVVVGVLLVLGLFSRLAAMAGIGLLLGVVATQPFWALAATNTFYQWIEIAALLVIFATAAGRFGGLDYFLTRRNAGPVNEA